MPGTVITDLRRRGAVDPGRLLVGPLRVVGLQHLAPGRSAEVGADGVEHALYVTAGSGVAALPEDAARPDQSEHADQSERADIGVALLEGTAVVLPLGSRTVLTAGTAGMEYFHAVLAAAPPRTTPEESEEGDPR